MAFAPTSWMAFDMAFMPTIKPQVDLIIKSVQATLRKHPRKAPDLVRWASAGRAAAERLPRVAQSLHAAS